MSTAVKKTLFQRGEDRLALEQLIRDYIAEHEGEIDDQFDAIVNEWMNETEGALAEKLDAYADVIASLTHAQQARKQEADRMAALARTDENAIQRLKARLLAFFETHDLPKFETNLHKFSVCQNGGKAPLTITDAPDRLPKQFQRVTVTADSDAIRQALDSGQELPFARIEPRGKHIRIK